MGILNDCPKDLIFTINTNKICYFPGETINGTVFLQAKLGFIYKELTNPSAIVKLNEYHLYEFDIKNEDGNYETDSTSKKNKLLELNMPFPKYQGANLLKGIELPFSLIIPECHPTCHFIGKNYVKHILKFEFPSLKAKKGEFIIIKNHQIFTTSNGLFQSPAIIKHEKEKHKFIISKGKFSAVAKLPKNAFAYDEEIIPFEISIDCSELELKIKRVEVILLKYELMNQSSNNSKVRFKKKKEISKKNYNLEKGKPNYLIKDNINFPERYNLITDYNNIDKMERKSIVLNSILLSPTCTGGLLSVEYYLKVKFIISSKLSRDEKIKIPLDFYVPYNHNKNENNSNVNYPCTTINKLQNESNKEKNILNNNNITNKNNLMINQQKIQGNIVDNYKNKNINNPGNNNNLNPNIIKNQNINNFKKQNTPLNLNNNVRMNNQPINNINNINYRRQTLPQNININNKITNNMRINQPLNMVYNNNFKNAQAMNNINNNNYNTVQPINNLYNNNYNAVQASNNLYNNNNNNKNASQNINNKYADKARANQFVNNINMDKKVIQNYQILNNGNKYYNQQYKNN